MHLSEHYSLGELCKTSVKMANIPSQEAIENLRNLCENWLEDLRYSHNSDIFIHQYDGDNVSKTMKCSWPKLSGDFCNGYDTITTYTYTDGKLSERSFCYTSTMSGDSCASYHATVTYEYEDDKLVRENTFQVGCGSSQVTATYEYDDNGRLSEVHSPGFSRTYEYDDEGNPVFNYWCQQWNSDKTQCLQAQIGCSAFL